jgi:hypothetical protein
MFLMDVFMADLDLWERIGVTKLDRACASTVKLNGDSPQVFELRYWSDVCLVLS